MKIAYIENPLDHSRLSNRGGVSTYIIKSLRESGAIVLPVQATKLPKILFVLKAYEKVLSLFGIKYQYRRNPRLLKAIAKNINQRIERIDVDAIVSFGSLPISYLHNSLPKYIWTDGVFENLLDYYGYYKNLSKTAIDNGKEAEYKGLSKARGIFFCSEFARSTAEKYYSDFSDKFYIAPFGANQDIENTKNDIEKYISQKQYDKIRLLFIGYNWAGKGGDKVVDIVRQLTKRGVKISLDVIGVGGAKNTDNLDINFHGRLNKSKNEDREIINDLLKSSHFLTLLSDYEQYGHVVCEASAYGLPTISTITGGLTEIVHNDINGQKFEINTHIDVICDYIQHISRDKQRYENLCRTSFGEYQNSLNWNSGAKIIMDIIKTN